MRIRLTVDGTAHDLDVEPRRLLVDVLRDDLGLTGTTVACGHGVCGSCTVLVDGVAQRSCLALAVQADGCSVRTVEGLALADGTLHPVQQAFHENHALQCGFCTPGFVMLLAGALEAEPDLDADEETLTSLLASNLCRCTGYVGIRAAAHQAAQVLRERAASPEG
ncbi:(2Fe-2S)-binding protein [Microlunatus spumicola]|uniref:(2Fe-2S)-binding protein n=1 Tax=Microlunatus spumicola TaxID=81499 RepID=A0ABP6XQC3_9ACTN